MPRTEKQGWSRAKIREEVDAVMADWNDNTQYPQFSQFFEALLKANDNMSVREFASGLSAKTSHKYQHSTPMGLRDGTSQPTYQIIVDIVNSNVLNLDPERINPSQGDDSDSSQRVALFTKAELIEVTRDSIQEFNADVLAGVKDHIRQNHKIHWSDIMRKLIDFHTQGERDSVVEIQRRLNRESKSGILFPTKDALPNILGKNAKAEDIQREALYEEAGLLPEQRQYLDDMLADKKISQEIQIGTPTHFSLKLDDILKTLNGGVSLQALQRASIDILSGKPRILGSQLSLLRQGKGTGPTLAKLRAIVDVLEPYTGEFGSGKPLRPGDIEDLIATTDYSRADIEMTARALIRNADENKPDIHKLLSNIRYALDVDITLDDIASPERMTRHQIHLTPDQINSWETSVKTCPTEEQTRELVTRYSDALMQRQHDLLTLKVPADRIPDDEIMRVAITPDEIDKVVRISQKSREAWEQSGKHEKKARMKDDITWRKRITSDIPTYGGNGFSH